MKLRDRAYQTFTRHLLDRQLMPGQFVTQRELATLTGMPLGAIREMIPRLEAEGLIRAIPQRGLQVANLDIRLVNDAFQLREIIECAALVQFLRTAPDEAIASQRAALDRIIEATRHGITGTLLVEAQAVDWGLHDALTDAMGNRLIADIHRVNAIRIRMIMQERVLLTPGTMPATLAEHVAILDALARRDEAAAVAALRAHLATARRIALSLDAEEQAPPGLAVGA